MAQNSFTLFIPIVCLITGTVLLRFLRVSFVFRTLLLQTLAWAPTLIYQEKLNVMRVSWTENRCILVQSVPSVVGSCSTVVTFEGKKKQRLLFSSLPSLSNLESQIVEICVIFLFFCRLQKQFVPSPSELSAASFSCQNF